MVEELSYLHDKQCVVAGVAFAGVYCAAHQTRVGQLLEVFPILSGPVRFCQVCTQTRIYFFCFFVDYFYVT